MLGKPPHAMRLPSFPAQAVVLLLHCVLGLLPSIMMPTGLLPDFFHAVMAAVGEHCLQVAGELLAECTGQAPQGLHHSRSSQLPLARR